MPPALVLGLSLTMAAAIPVALSVLRPISVKDTTAFLKRTENILLAVLGVMIVINEILESVKRALMIAVDIFDIAKRLFQSLQVLVAWGRWTQWADTLWQVLVTWGQWSQWANTLWRLWRIWKDN
ncbi:uncharacterized protein N7479_001746 [Penicillium vulpinum]|uniref:uncharacterized protein n=1 Tax=Penicillium vulpinum TaxID=29845 RepID=UPI002548A927|nr:uncharacterized protein N7479_001746 [Penicillium vulpinum]KAJ5971828.1 hypothetical protein N7479_001746 [Penicillium vulpinum]